jgi:cobalamin biosynthesis Mg chelatase CobN
MPLKLLVCLIMALAATMFAPATVLARGPSAGDQQYTDPLAGSGNSSTQSQSTHTSTAPSSGTSAPAPSSSAPSATSSSAPSSSSSTSPNTSGTPTNATSSTSGASSGNPMPVTGYDLPLAVLAGAGLLASGAWLRRATRKA